MAEILLEKMPTEPILEDDDDDEVYLYSGEPRETDFNFPSFPRFFALPVLNFRTRKRRRKRAGGREREEREREAR